MYKMPCGPHLGSDITTVPFDYLEWAETADWPAYHEGLPEAIAAELHRRRHNPKCDFNFCTSPVGEVRWIAASSDTCDGRLATCRACYDVECSRRERDDPILWLNTPAWDRLTIRVD